MRKEATTGTMTSDGQQVTLELGTGQKFTTKDGGNFVQRLDKQLRANHKMREGYRPQDGVLVTTVTWFVA